MKKIGILFGQERNFPMAIIERINKKNVTGVSAEPVRIDKVIQGASEPYAVIIDRISHKIPFYRSYLKNAALGGTAVLNNPFWSSADEKFFNNSVAVHSGIPVPKTVILPSREIPENSTDLSFSNLAYPLDWESIFNYVGFPCYMKPYRGGDWKHVYRIMDADDFFLRHAETGKMVMLLQEEIRYEEYYRCMCIGGKYIYVMNYDPRHPHHLRYQTDYQPSAETVRQLEEIVLRLNRTLGYDINAVEIGLKEGVPYAIDFCNPAPEIDPATMGQDHFEWIVETTATYAIERALQHRNDDSNLTWGAFITDAVSGKSIH